MKHEVDEDLLIMIANYLNPDFFSKMNRVDVVKRNYFLRAEIAKILTKGDK